MSLSASLLQTKPSSLQLSSFTIGNPVECDLYRHHAIPGGTCLTAELARELMQECHGIMKRLLSRFAKERHLIDLLADKYKPAYERLIAELEQGRDIDETLTLGSSALGARALSSFL